MFRKIVVVCTGNICRSPIAEALLSSQLSARGIQVSSAGIAAMEHYPADATAQLVAAENGYDLSRHIAKQATHTLLAGMDLILTLDSTHSAWIQARFPQFLGRTYKLGRWRGNMDIADPYRKPRTAFDKAFREISECSADWLKRLPGEAA